MAKRFTTSLLALGTTLAVTSSALGDSEPVNNDLPSFPNGIAEVMFEPYSNARISGYEISSSADNDYIVIVCPNATELLHSVVMNFTHSVGDLDMTI